MGQLLEITNHVNLAPKHVIYNYGLLFLVLLLPDFTVFQALASRDER